MPLLSLAEVSRITGGIVHGEPGRMVARVASLDAAGPDALSLVASSRYLPYVQTTRAAALLISAALSESVPAGPPRVVVDDPHASLVRLLPVLYPEPEITAGVHPTAVLESGVELGDEVVVGAYAVLGAGSRVGEGSRIGSHVTIGVGCIVGPGTVLHPHVSLYSGVHLGARCVIRSGARVGSEGFGYAWIDGGHRKIPQVGGCVIGDDVEIGANTTIDRGSIGDTVVGRGTKIDNLVHVGHNVRIGEHVIVVAQVGVSGSTVIGDGAVLGGQAGLGGHLSIGAGARVGAQAGVMGDVAPGSTVSGYPARPHGESMRASAALHRLPRLMERIRRIERVVFPNRST